MIGFVMILVTVLKDIKGRKENKRLSQKKHAWCGGAHLQRVHDHTQSAHADDIETSPLELWGLSRWL